MRPRSGLTLFETMITMGLISLTLALTAGLMRLYSQGARVKGVQGVAFDALRAVLHQVRSETLGAVSFESPDAPSASWSPVLEFSKIDRKKSTRLENFPTGWTPYDLQSTGLENDFLVGVRFRQEDQSLVRAFRHAESSAWTSGPIIENKLAEFGCRLGDDHTVELRIVIEGRHRNPIFTSKSMRRVR